MPEYEHLRGLRVHKGMTHVAKLLLVCVSLVLLCCAWTAHAQSDITLVSTVDPQLIDAQALRAALETELQVSTVLREQPSGPTLQVSADTLQAVRVSFLREDKPPVERTLDVSSQAEHAASIVALLASNLVRDEASELLAQLAAAAPKPQPAAPALAPEQHTEPPPRPFVNHACGPNKLQRVTIGADFVPYLGTSMRDGTRVERKLSFNLIGGITGGVRGIELGGVFNIDRHSLCGAQFAGTFNFVGGDAAGAQFSAVNIVGGTFLGAQFGQVNVVGSDLMGPQFGLLNLAGGRTSGAQLGLTNISVHGLGGAQLGLLNVDIGRTHGAQLGLVNVTTERVEGAMVGLVNVAQDANAAVGLVNVIWNGRAQLDAWGTDGGLLMVGATQGARFTHNIYGIGIRPMGDLPAFATTLGIGVRVYSSSSLTVDIDALSYGIMRKNPDVSRIDFASIHQLRVPVSLSPVKGIWFFVAPSVSVSTVERDSHLWQEKLALFGSQRLSSADADVTVRIWPGASVGARFF